MAEPNPDFPLVRGSHSPRGQIVATVSAVSVVVAALFLVWALFGLRTMRRALVSEAERETLALLQSLILASQYSLAAGSLVDQMEREDRAQITREFAIRFNPASRNDALAREILDAEEADGYSAWLDNGAIAIAPAALEGLLAGHPEIADFGWDTATEIESFSLLDSANGTRWVGTGIPTSWGGFALWSFLESESVPAALGGVGELIQEIGSRSEIDYVMLQSPDGIVFASRPLKPVLKLALDSFLVAVLEANAPATRETVFEGIPILEAAAPFLSTDLPSGMYRVGISLGAINDAVDRLTWQLGFTGLLIILLATAVSAVLISRRSLADLGRSYRQVETLTGRVLDAIDQAVIAVDREGKVTVFNPTAERWFAISADRALGQTISRALGDDPFEMESIRVGSLALREKSVKRQTVRGERLLVFSTTPLTTAEDSRNGAVAVIRDETSAQAMAEQVRRAERLSAMGQLAAGVAHEVRNPLNAVALAAQRLKLEMSDPESMKLADTIWTESKRLNTIVDDFLSLARPSSQPRTRVNLAEVVQSVAQIARIEADKKRVELCVTAKAACPIDGIEDDLRKAVWNLVSNSLAATPPGGAIHLMLSCDGHDAKLMIEDTGAGIPPDLLGRVFEPWLTTKVGGTGLGLPITQRIVQDHGGAIAINSPSPNRGTGTIVEVQIPLAK